MSHLDSCCMTTSPIFNPSFEVWDAETVHHMWPTLQVEPHSRRQGWELLTLQSLHKLMQSLSDISYVIIFIIYPILIAFFEVLQVFQKIFWLEYILESSYEFSPVSRMFCLVHTSASLTSLQLLSTAANQGNAGWNGCFNGSPRAPPHLLVHWHRPCRFPAMSNSLNSCGGNKAAMWLVSNP